MASTKGLVPITRPFLAKFYDKHPFDPISLEAAKLQETLVKLSDELNGKIATAEGETDLVSKLTMEAPHKVDENLWRNREQMEELMFLLDESHWPASLKDSDQPAAAALREAIPVWKESLDTMFTTVSDYQKGTADKVFQMVLTYMPQDFRCMLIKQQRAMSERRRDGEVEALIAKGGSIADKYHMLWKQQMERRQTLASLGSATGVYRAFVTLLVGVPQVLLDFVKTINDHDGPMDEQRSRYGPPVYQLTSFINRVRILLALWWADFDQSMPQCQMYIDLISACIKLYTSEFKRYIAVLQVIFENAPFLISAEDALSDEEKNRLQAFSEVNILAGYKHEVPLSIDTEGLMITWDFFLTVGQDIGFSMDLVDDVGSKKGLVPYQRVAKLQGSFDVPATGNYVITFDNSYSFWNSKTIKFKVDSLPTAQQVEAEAEAQVKAEETAAH